MLDLVHINRLEQQLRQHDLLESSEHFPRTERPDLRGDESVTDAVHPKSIETQVKNLASRLARLFSHRESL
jgi:hypothetical protein